MHGLRRVQKRYRTPVVLTPEETKRVLALMDGTPRLMAQLMYGSGLRVIECVSLRIKDVDLSAHVITVRDGKGGKDRTTVLPERLHGPLQQQLLRVAALNKHDTARGGGLAPLPNALARKYLVSICLACLAIRLPIRSAETVGTDRKARTLARV